ncbi:hypothetical protein B1964_01180, partial [Gordonia sp. i37]
SKDACVTLTGNSGVITHRTAPTTPAMTAINVIGAERTVGDPVGRSASDSEDGAVAGTMTDAM